MIAIIGYIFFALAVCFFLVATVASIILKVRNMFLPDDAIWKIAPEHIAQLDPPATAEELATPDAVADCLNDIERLTRV